MSYKFSKLVSQSFSVFSLTSGISKSANFNYTAVLWLQKVQMDAKRAGRRGREERTVSTFWNKACESLAHKFSNKFNVKFFVFPLPGGKLELLLDGSTTSSNNKTVS